MSAMEDRTHGLVMIQFRKSYLEGTVFQGKSGTARYGGELGRQKGTWEASEGLSEAEESMVREGYGSGTQE